MANQTNSDILLVALDGGRLQPATLVATRGVADPVSSSGSPPLRTASTDLLCHLIATLSVGEWRDVVSASILPFAAAAR